MLQPVAEHNVMHGAMLSLILEGRIEESLAPPIFMVQRKQNKNDDDHHPGQYMYL